MFVEYIDDDFFDDDDDDDKTADLATGFPFSRSSKKNLMRCKPICTERSEEERMMSTSLHMSIETVAFQTALAIPGYSP